MTRWHKVWDEVTQEWKYLLIENLQADLMGTAQLIQSIDERPSLLGPNGKPIERPHRRIGFGKP